MKSLTDRVVAAGLAASTFALYRVTLAPGLVHPPGDSHELTMTIARLGLAHPTGYPLYTWVGWLFMQLWPFGEVAHRANLLSAVLGAAGVGMLYLVGRTLGLGRPASAIGALFFGVSTTFWSQAVLTEVYAPNVFALTLTLWLALRWAAAVEHDGASTASDHRFIGFAFAYGLSLGMHLSNFGFAPAYALFVLLVDPRILTRPSTVALAIGAFVLAAAQFSWVPLRATAADLYPNVTPRTLTDVYGYTLGAFAKLRFSFGIEAQPSRMSIWVNLLVANFTAAGMAFGLLGLWTLLWRDVKRFWLLVPMYTTHVAFFSQLAVLDPDPFFIASHVLFALFLGFGLDATMRTVARVPAIPQIATLGWVLVLSALLVEQARGSYRANDRSTDTATPDFYDAVFDVLPSQAVLLARGRGMFGATVAYQRRYRQNRPDVLVGTEYGAAPPPPGAETFTVLRPPIGVRKIYLPREPRYVAVLRGARHPLVLDRVEDATRPRAEDIAFRPDAHVERDLGAAALMAVDLTLRRSFRPARVALRLLWRVDDDGRPPIVTTRVGDFSVEAHELLVDSVELAAPGAHRLVAEAFELVVPSHLDAGTHALAVGVVDLHPAGVRTHWTPVGEVVIE